MIIIKIDCCGHPQMLCGLSVWTLSDAMRAKGLTMTYQSKYPAIKVENHFLLESLAECENTNSKLTMYFTVNTAFVNYLG